MTRAGNAGPDAWPTELLQAVGHLPPHSRVCVALSGGLDSVLLLHAAASAGLRDLFAIHVNHQLQSNAFETEAFCQRLCETLGVHCVVRKVDVPMADSGEGSGGLEEAAREARYQVFESLLQAGDLLLMAHHSDDQAETVLFRAIRGSGVAGLAGMPQSRRLGQAVLYRPLLPFSRAQLESWAQEQALEWVDDPSNADQRFDRNFLRHNVLPALRERWPTLNQRLAATAEACRESAALSLRLASLQYEQCATREGHLALGALDRLPVTEQKNLVRWWVEQRGFVAPNPANWSQLLAEFRDSAEDRQPEFRGDGYTLRRFQGALRVVPDEDIDQRQSVSLTPETSVIWGNWLIRLESEGGNEQPSPSLRVTIRQGGERIRERIEGPSKPLKQWFQERQVPTWERGRLPLIMRASNEPAEALAVGDLWVSDAYRGAAPASGWRLIVERISN